MPPGRRVAALVVALWLTGETGRAQAPVGRLALEISPPALVLVDNTELGIVERRQVTLSAGVHRVRIVHREFEPLRRTVTIRAGAETVLSIDLLEKGVPRPAVGLPGGAQPQVRRDGRDAGAGGGPPAPVPEKGELRVVVQPDAQVWVDDELKGTGGTLVLSVSLGRHDVRIVHPRYLPLARRVTVSRKPVTLTIDLGEKGVRRDGGSK